MYFDRFDICDAYYCFAVDWHGGQFSPEYAILGRLKRMGYSAGYGGIDYDRLTANGKAIYNNLLLNLEG